ncbi:MarR family transcriptional regulator [Pseudoalteromonas maricaloris]|uniref:MarR family transcriptional regulator n=1 Tax=Pseudoalteromonas maricaloris TaxID=184924 RepID=UPI00029AC2E2|nr:MarR family transcriptional regulator [Pseudoalteromonas flavipulchra]
MKSPDLSTTMQRGLNAIKALSGHEADGMRPGELAKSLDITQPQATAVIKNLIHAGFAERCPWDQSKVRLGPTMITLANSAQLAISQRAIQIEQDRKNFGATL